MSALAASLFSTVSCLVPNSLYCLITAGSTFFLQVRLRSDELFPKGQAIPSYFCPLLISAESFPLGLRTFERFGRRFAALKCLHQTVVGLVNPAAGFWQPGEIKGAKGSPLVSKELVVKQLMQKVTYHINRLVHVEPYSSRPGG